MRTESEKAWLLYFLVFRFHVHEKCSWIYETITYVFRKYKRYTFYFLSHLSWYDLLPSCLIFSFLSVSPLLQVGSDDNIFFPNRYRYNFFLGS